MMATHNEGWGFLRPTTMMCACVSCFAQLTPPCGVWYVVRCTYWRYGDSFNGTAEPLGYLK